MKSTTFLRPEVIETYFVMWRLTKRPQIQRLGLGKQLRRCRKNCQVEHGFSGIKDVYASSPEYDDVQQSFFLAETLKIFIFCSFQKMI